MYPCNCSAASNFQYSQNSVCGVWCVVVAAVVVVAVAVAVAVVAVAVVVCVCVCVCVFYVL